MTGTLEFVKVTTFGQALALLREERGYSHRELSNRACCSKADLKAWERGEGFPSAIQFKRLWGSVPRLWGFVDMLPHEASQEARAEKKKDEAPVAVRLPEPEEEKIVEPPPPKSFGEALRRARLREGLDQHEVADMLSVEQGSVSRWELDTNAPIADHHRKLCDLMPGLKNAPKPVTREIEKPAGNVYGVYRTPGEAPVERTPFVAPVAPIAVVPPAPPPPVLTIAPIAMKMIERPTGKQAAIEEAGLVYAKSLARTGEALARLDAAEIEFERAGRERDAAMIASNEAADRLFLLTIGARPSDPEYDRKIAALKKKLRESFLSDAVAKGA